jgi:hypothetical protein
MGVGYRTGLKRGRELTEREKPRTLSLFLNNKEGTMSIVRVDGFGPFYNASTPNEQARRKGLLETLRGEIAQTVANSTTQHPNHVDVRFLVEEIGLASPIISCQIPLLVYEHHLLERSHIPLYRRKMAQGLHQILAKFCKGNHLSPSLIQVHVAEPIHCGYDQYYDGRNLRSLRS